MEDGNLPAEPTNLKSANLEGAVLDGADLRGVDLSQALGLSASQLASAITDETTKLPVWSDDLAYLDSK